MPFQLRVELEDLMEVALAELGLVEDQGEEVEEHPI